MIDQMSSIQMLYDCFCHTEPNRTGYVILVYDYRYSHNRFYLTLMCYIMKLVREYYVYIARIVSKSSHCISWGLLPLGMVSCINKYKESMTKRIRTIYFGYAHVQCHGIFM